MRVLFDCRYVKDGARDGISRFSIELAKALAERVDVTMLVRDERQLEHLPQLPHVVGPSEVGVLEPLTGWRLRSVPADVLFSPMQTIGTIGRAWPVVTTVHDLIYYRHPEPPRDLPGFVRLLWRIYHKAMWPQRMLLRGADAVVTISDATRRLMTEHRLDVRPIHVVPNASAPLGAPVTVQEPAGRRLVYMGSFMPYKNVETLVRAMRELPDYELHLAARISDDDRRRLQDAAPVARIVFHNGISDDDYAELLRQSTALVTASRDEGFGIPLLESMALGVPVVVSDIGIFHEVAGEAGLYADPDTPEEFAARVRELERPEVWAERSKAAAAQAERFSWERSAAELHGFLREVATRSARRRAR